MNMLLYNTTYHVDQDRVGLFLIWLREKFVPEVQASGLLARPRIYKVLSHLEEGVESYCLQWDVDSSGTLHHWYTLQGAKLHEELARTFQDKVIGIPTLMEELG